MATQMCLAHNLQIRSLNAIYIQATSLASPSDISDFFTYCQCWYEVLDHHHRLEEEFLFPELEKRLNLPGVMDESIDQHRGFHEKLDVWGKTCYNTKPEDYNGDDWRKMIDDFAVPLMKHLHDEVGVLEGIAEHDPEGKVMAEIGKVLDTKAKEDADKSRTFPIMLSSADTTFEGGTHHFPPVPWFAVILIDWIYARKHRGAWRFSPSDMHGRPRPLQFVGGN